MVQLKGGLAPPGPGDMDHGGGPGAGEGGAVVAGRHSTVSPHRPGGAGARAWTAGMAACITTGCEALDSALGNCTGAVRACRVRVPCAMCAG